MGLPEVSAVVASIASAAELRAVVAATHAATPDLDWASMQLEPATIAAGSRLRPAARQRAGSGKPGHAVAHRPGLWRGADLAGRGGGSLAAEGVARLQRR
jgi:hypothetical protein